jgi:hypothetical protein
MSMSLHDLSVESSDVRRLRAQGSKVSVLNKPEVDASSTLSLMLSSVCDKPLLRDRQCRRVLLYDRGRDLPPEVSQRRSSVEILRQGFKQEYMTTGYWSCRTVLTRQHSQALRTQEVFMPSRSRKNPNESAGGPDPLARPTKEECWANFWEGIAAIWFTLPLEVQQDYARRFPPPK